MDEVFESGKETTCRLIKLKTLDVYWKKVSENVERVWLEHMEVDKDTAKRMKGRGEVKFHTAKPNIRTKADKKKSIRNTEMHKTTESLRQARRCDQVNHRLERSREAEPSMKAKYEVLNKEAIGKTNKDLDLKDDKDEEFKVKLQKVTNKEIELTMLGPTLKLQMRRYHQLHDTWERRAVGK